MPGRKEMPNAEAQRRGDAIKKIIVFGSAVCALFLILLPAALAQDNNIPKYTVRVDIVSIDVEVLDKDGNTIPDLTQKDFTVQENGNEKEIVHFARLHDNPVSLAILLDTSTIELRKLNIAKQFILDIIHLLGHKDDISLFSFDNRDAYREVDFTTDRPSIVNAIENIAVSSKRKWGFLSEFFGSDPATALAIDRAIHSQRKSAHPKKALLVISNRFRGLGPVTVDHIQESRCTLYALGFSNKSASIRGFGDQISKRQLMSESGGRMFSAETEDIMGVSRAIVSSMKNYYSIGYKTDADLEERRIEVRIPGHDYVLNTRRTITE